MLRDCGSAVGILDFIPAYPGGISHRVVKSDRFMRTEVATVEGAGVNAATEMLVGPVKVEFAGVVKST